MVFETGYEHEGARIEMTPLMDVVFLLLVFFIYAIAHMTTVSAVSVALPEADSEEAHGNHLVITLCADGSTWLDDERVVQEGLAEMIIRRDRNAPILIRVDRNVPMGRGLSVLSDLQKADLTSVAFQTSEPVSQSANPESAEKDRTAVREDVRK